MARSSRGEDARKARRRGYSLARAYAVLFFLGRHPETVSRCTAAGPPLPRMFSFDQAGLGAQRTHAVMENPTQHSAVDPDPGGSDAGTVPSPFANVEG